MAATAASGVHRFFRATYVRASSQSRNSCWRRRSILSSTRPTWSSFERSLVTAPCLLPARRRRDEVAAALPRTAAHCLAAHPQRKRDACNHVDDGGDRQRSRPGNARGGRPHDRPGEKREPRAHPENRDHHRGANHPRETRARAPRLERRELEMVAEQIAHIAQQRSCPQRERRRLREFHLCFHSHERTPTGEDSLRRMTRHAACANRRFDANGVGGGPTPRFGRR